MKSPATCCFWLFHIFSFTRAGLSTAPYVNGVSHRRLAVTFVPRVDSAARAGGTAPLCDAPLRPADTASPQADTATGCHRLTSLQTDSAPHGVEEDELHVRSRLIAGPEIPATATTSSSQEASLSNKPKRASLLGGGGGGLAPTPEQAAKTTNRCARTHTCYPSPWPLSQDPVCHPELTLSLP
eukprot:scaffold22503_cov52-Phaeocystis_antarctica.AAC.3